MKFPSTAISYICAALRGNESKWYEPGYKVTKANLRHHLEQLKKCLTLNYMLALGIENV